MKKVLILALIALFFVGCGSITRPTPISSDIIQPNERCN